DRIRCPLAIVHIRPGSITRRRHRPPNQGIDDLEPQLGIAPERLLVLELAQVDVTFWLIAAVAAQTVFLEQWPDVLVEAVATHRRGHRDGREKRGQVRHPSGDRGLSTHGRFRKSPGAGSVSSRAGFVSPYYLSDNGPSSVPSLQDPRCP